MKNLKRILSILAVCAMLLAVIPMTVAAAGTQDDPIDAATKWFGYGVNTYLLNPSIAEGSDGMWYTLTAEQDGILALEHKYKNVDYTVTVSVNGKDYVGGSVDGVIYNGPIMTLPMKTGDVATIAIVTKDAAAGTVYASMNVIAGDEANTIKVKSEGIVVHVAAGQTVYFQDDSLNAIYATKGLLVEGNVANTTFYSINKNSESGATSKKAYIDSDADGIIEAKLGGSLGGAGAPPVKPAWAIENHSAEDQTYTLTIVDAAHECVYDDDADVDCNSCGAVREVTPAECEHQYDDDHDADCNICGEVREVAPKHIYSHDYDVVCNECEQVWRSVELPVAFKANSISEDINGLAFLFDIEVAGMQVNRTTAIYDNATVGQYKLVGMGAVASNDGTNPTRCEGKDWNILDIPAVYLYDLEGDVATYAIRIKNIPDEYKDEVITVAPYFIIEVEGKQYTVYGDIVTASYESVANG